MKGRYFRLLLNRAKAFPSLRPALSCRLLLALLVLVLSVGGTTYAWMTSRGVVNSASVHVEKIKVSAGGLTIRGDGEWKPLDLEDSCIVSFDKLIKAAEAKERLSAAYQIPNSPYPSSSYTFDGDLESVMEAQFFFKVENLGDEAFAFVETNDMLGVSFANNAFMLPLPEDEAYDNNDFIWFEDVVLESYGILGTIVESEYITAKDIQSAIYEL
jgi:hypothetical protein